MPARLLVLIGALAVAAPLLAQSEMVIVKKGGSEYHRPGCDVISDGVGVLAMTRAQAEGRKLKPHAACDPANAETPSGKAAEKNAIVHVYVDDKGKYYHREKCERLGDGKKKMTLDEAGKKYWPCTVCKPPIRKRPIK